MRNSRDRTSGSWFVPLFHGVHVILAVMLLGFIYWFPPVDVREVLKIEDAHIADAKQRMSE